jgi:inosine-uridine nucleoside N-ribohydrolase
MFARSRKSYDDLPDAHILYRQILAKQPDHSVVIATVGFSTNLARLLDTPADEYSPLTGKELVAKKVKLLSVMAGNISELEHHEYNVVKDLPAAIKVFAEWPTEIVVSPFEVGRAIKYPGESIENDFTWAPKHPMVEAYKAYLPMPYDRPTWDLTSVLYAVEGDSWFTVSEPGRIHIDEVGSSIFTPCGDGNMRYLMVDEAQSAAILQRFKDIITCPPHHLSR